MVKEDTKRNFPNRIEIRCSAILFNKNNELLLVKHKKNNEEYWVLPGGKLKYKETLENCLKRELKEELNLDIKLKKFLTINEFITKKRHRIDLFFLCKIINLKDLKFKKTNVLKDYRFGSIKELSKIDFRPRNLIKWMNKS